VPGEGIMGITSPRERDTDAPEERDSVRRRQGSQEAATGDEVGCRGVRRDDAARDHAARSRGRTCGRRYSSPAGARVHAADEKDLPLADRRSQKRGLLLLRRHLGAGAAVLQLSSRGCICAAATKVAEVRRQGALPAARQPSFNRADACCPCPVLPKRGNSAAAAGA
jgi:hypothetical protein